jgi:hypothetical protein
MALKYASTPQLNYGYGSPGAADRLRSKLPSDAMPITTAPMATATPVLIYSVDAKPHWALPHRGGWQKLQAYKDFKTGAVSWRMNGEQINQPIAWSMPRRGK